MTKEQKAIRKLRAILSADVKGYSLLMADDEAFTIKTLKKYRNIMSTQIEQHNGRVVDSPGDNILAEFASAVDAVECAVEIQKSLKVENEDLPDEKKLEFRIGVNIGDIVKDGDRIYGSGVNVAAHIEGLSDPGGVYVSRNAYDHIKEKLNFGYEYLGDHEVKNIKDPVRVYKILTDPKDTGKLVGVKEQPSAKKWIWSLVAAVVILLGIVTWQYYQKIITPDFEPASAENMSFPLPDKPSIAVLPFVNMSEDPKQEYFSDGITEEIIKAMQVELTKGETARVAGRDTKNLDAYLKTLEADELWQDMTKERNTMLRQLAMEAISLDPQYGYPHAIVSWSHMVDVWYQTTESSEESMRLAAEWIQKALALDDSDHRIHEALSNLYIMQGKHDDAIASAQRALELCPGGFGAYQALGLALVYACKYGEAIPFREQAIKLDPFPDGSSYRILGDAYNGAKRYEEARQVYKKAL